MMTSMYMFQILNNISINLQMSLDDDDFLVKIKVKISKLTVYSKRKHLNQLEKWRATRANMDGVGIVLAWESVLAWLEWVACVTC